ncbi:MAG: hypothetical protein ACK40K_00460 [Raineya sp.]
MKIYFCTFLTTPLPLLGISALVSERTSASSVTRAEPRSMTQVGEF